MITQFITDDKGKKTAAIVPISEYEDLTHQYHFSLDLTEEYKNMIDIMLQEDENGQAQYVSFDHIKNRFADK